MTTSRPCKAGLAAHTLEVDEPRALAKIAELERSDNPHISMDAEYLRREWESGALKFFPPSEGG